MAEYLPPRQTIQLTDRELLRLRALAAAAGVPKASLSDAIRIALAMAEDCTIGPKAQARKDAVLAKPQR